MKGSKFFICVLALLFAVSMLAGCAASGEGEGGGGGVSSFLTMLLPLVVLFVLMYFMTIRPENKRRKKAQEMRDSVEVGDKITTIGGMVGKVVHVTSDKITFETGEDRVRIEVNKWAISSNEGKGANKETTDSEETLNDQNNQ